MSTSSLTPSLRAFTGDISTSAPWRVGIDVGGTKTDVVVVARSGAIVERATAPTSYGPDGVLATISALVNQLLSELALTPLDIDAYGVGIPGTVSPGAGVVRNAVNLGISEMPLRDELERLFARPVVVENDVNATAVGVHRELGLTADKSLAFVNLGTGLAAGLVLGGRLWRGASGGAGEIGHIPLRDGTLVCACGQRGCAELFASGGGIRRSEAHVVAEGGTISTGLAEATAAVLQSLTLTLDVDVLALGGGLVAHTPDLLECVIEALRQGQKVSPLLLSYDIPSRIVAVPTDRPIAALGAALLPGGVR